ncbi:hypothetical protein FJ911_15120 [Lactiplantibacillus plantarum]|nr:hypothetical protein FJ911_15120 [Lactiplantibacillus plantarum]
MVNTILKEADLFCPNSVRINFTIYHGTKKSRHCAGRYNINLHPSHLPTMAIYLIVIFNVPKCVI